MQELTVEHAETSMHISRPASADSSRGMTTAEDDGVHAPGAETTAGAAHAEQCDPSCSLPADPAAAEPGAAEAAVGVPDPTTSAPAAACDDGDMSGAAAADAADSLAASAAASTSTAAADAAASMPVPQALQSSAGALQQPVQQPLQQQQQEQVALPAPSPPSSSSGSSRRTSRTRVGETPAVLPCLPAQQPHATVPPGLATGSCPWDQQPMVMQPAATAATAAAVPAVAAAGLQAPQPIAAAKTTAGGDQSQQPCRVMAPCYRKAASSSILSLHIHGTSQLVPDLLLTDPVMRLHVVQAATGEYVRMLQELTDGSQQQQQQQQQQHPQQQHQQQQQQGLSGGSTSPQGSNLPRARHPLSSDLQAELLHYPGRPAQSTLDSNTPNPTAALLSHIPAVQTRPYSMISLTSSGSSSGSDTNSSRAGWAAAWEEELCVDMAPDVLAQADAILLLELLQLPGGFARYKRHAGDFGKSGSGHSIAWGFLRLSGLQQQQLMAGQQPLKLRLQLYHYSPGSLKPEGLLSPRLAVPHPESAAKAAYLSFKLSGFLSQPQQPLLLPQQQPAQHANVGSHPGSPITRPGAQASTAAGSSSSAAGNSGNGSGSGSPWRVGLWHPWGSEVAASPGLPTQLVAGGVAKYPGYIEVTLSAIPRPAGAVVVTDPAAGIRPALPAGYGSGFEIGRMPVSLLYVPRAMRGSRGGSAGGMHSRGASAGGRLSLEDAMYGSGALVDEELLLLESRLHRPHTHACQVPNALLAEIKGTSGGCSAISISREGRWLAAACGDDKGRFQVVMYQALTGRLCWVLGSHAGMVHSISWAKDDSALVTASADHTVKVWHLPQLPGPPCNSQHSGSLHHLSGMQYEYGDCSSTALQQSTPNIPVAKTAGLAQGGAVFGSSSSSSSMQPDSPTHRLAGSSRMSAGGGSSTLDSLPGLEQRQGYTLGLDTNTAAAGVSVLQHTCFVYAAEMHPTLQPVPVVVTAGFDGVLRLWSMDGVVLHSLLVSSVPVNCIAFDQLGTRLFAGDAAGVLTEVSLDLTPLTTAAATWSHPGCAASAPGSSSGGWAAGSTGSSSGSAREEPAASDSTQTAAAGAEGLVSIGGTGGVAAATLVASVLRNGSTATQQLAGAQLMKKLRASNELAGTSIMALSCHPGGHHLVVLARSPKGVSDLVALDAKLLLVARHFTGIRCNNLPIKFGLSPDGQYVLCGSEDGSTTIWDFATATPTPVMHMALGHAPTHCMVWSSCFQAVAVCSFSHYAPIRVLGFAADQQQVLLNPPVQQPGRSKVSQEEVASLAELHRPLRCPLPDRLTPEHVHALLSDLRLSASQRGLYSQPSDPNGQQLIVAAHRRQQPPRRLGSRPAAAAGSAGSGIAQAAPAVAQAPVATQGSGQLAAQQQQGSGATGPGALQVAGGSSKVNVQGLLESTAAGSVLGGKVAAAGMQQLEQQGLIAARGSSSSQPSTPRVIDGMRVSAGSPAPWQS